MASALPLKDLLKPTYNPADDSQPRFPLNYDQLVKHRDLLREKYNAREQRRLDREQAESSATAFEGKGNSYGALANLNSSPLTTHKYAVRLTKAQLSQLAIQNRKKEVDKIKEDIDMLGGEKERKKEEEEKKKEEDAEAAEQEEGGDSEGAENEKPQDGAQAQEDQDEASEPELGQDWKTVEPRNKKK